MRAEVLNRVEWSGVECEVLFELILFEPKWVRLLGVSRHTLLKLSNKSYFLSSHDKTRSNVKET